MRKKQSIQMIADYDGDATDLLTSGGGGEMPILTTRNVVFFPGVLTPLLIGRKKSLNIIKKAEDNTFMVFAVFCQTNEDTEDPGEKDIFRTGVMARLVRVIDVPGDDNTRTAIIQALGRERPQLPHRCRLAGHGEIPRR